MAAKLFVGNLDYTVTTDDLRDCFASVGGTMLDCVVVMDKYTGRSRGFGFVEYETEEQAQEAIDKLNEKELKGRNIRVSMARPPKDAEDSDSQKPEPESAPEEAESEDSEE